MHSFQTDTCSSVVKVHMDFIHNQRCAQITVITVQTPCKTAFHIYHDHIFSCIIGFLQLSSPWINISIRTPRHCSWSIWIDSPGVHGYSLRELLSQLHCKPKQSRELTDFLVSACWESHWPWKTHWFLLNVNDDITKRNDFAYKIS